MPPNESESDSSTAAEGIGRRRFLRTAGAAATTGIICSGSLPGWVSATAATGATPATDARRLPRRAAKPFALDQVTLGRGTLFTAKRDRILDLLSNYPPERVLHNFRVTAGLAVPSGSEPPGGWDDETGNLRGHYSGHLITAMCQAYASTKDPLYKDKVDYIVHELGRCQEALDATVGAPAPEPEPVEWNPGRFGNAVTLTGTNYVCLPRGIVDGIQDFTVAVWVKPSQVPTWSRIFDFGTGTDRYMFLTANAGTAPRFAITTGGGSAEQRLNGSTELATGIWTHIAVTLSGNTASLYLDGTKVDTNPGMTLRPADLGDTGRNWIGRSQYGDPYLPASIDELHIYDRALPQSDIRALTESADGARGGGTLARYRFDESHGDSAVDTSGNDRHATVVSESPGAPGPEYPGFLSAYPETQFIRLERGATYPDVWAPYYTLHKIMRGLLDAHEHTGNKRALDIASRMGNWAHNRLSRLPREQRSRIWATYIAGEYGGMNEVMAELYALTGEQKHLDTAKYFDNRESLFGACLRNQDVLTRLHANTHVPQFTGYLRIFEQTGEPEYFTTTENFWAMVVPHRMFSHGGTSGTWAGTPGLPGNTNPELFQPRDSIAGAIAGHGAETCTSYNLLKVARTLFLHTTDPDYMDYYERTLLNHILGSKEDVDSTSDPNVTYFLPMSPGNGRSFGNIGTCCGGTGLENHTKYQESIYFRSADESALYVNLYIASTLTWRERGFTITQDTDYPREEVSRITVDGSGPLDIKLRVPRWARHCTIRINGVEQHVEAEPGTYLSLDRTWEPGDTIEVVIHFPLRVERAIDRHDTQSVFHGPVLLSALSGEESYRRFSFYRHFTLDGDLTAALDSVGGGRFSTHGHTLRPLYVGDTTPHHPYFRRHEPRVVFGSVDSGVPNYEEEPGGDTLLDVIWAEAPFDNHGKFTAAVARTLADWRRRGLITTEERRAVRKAAHEARTDLRRAR